MFALKLALVAASILLASLAARRFGHGVSGTLGGMPMIAGPIMGFVLLGQPDEQARAIALATLICVPAMVLHMVVFAHAARRLPWYGALLAANTAFVASGWALANLALPAVAACALALLAPPAGMAAIGRRGADRAPRQLLAGATVGAVATGAVPATCSSNGTGATRAAGASAGMGAAGGADGGEANGRAAGVAAPVTIPRAELALRVAVAIVLAAAIMQGAERLPTMVSGLLLALPITGNVLPCFTLPRHGAAATAVLLRGFLWGVFGFVSFFVTLYATLPVCGAAWAYGLAWLAAATVALSAYGVRRRVRTDASAAA